MRKVLIALFVIALVLGNLHSAMDMEIDTDPQVSPISQTQELTFFVNPVCLGDPCESDAVEFEIVYSAPGIVDESVFHTRGSQQPAQIVYRCNSYPQDCNPPSSEEFSISAYAIDSNGDRIDYVFPKLRDFTYENAINSPPVPEFQQQLPPSIEDGKVRIPFTIDSTDDEILLTNIDIILEVPDGRPHPPVNFHTLNDPNWRIVQDLTLIEANEYFAALEYSCMNANCGDMAQIIIMATDPRDETGVADYIIEPPRDEPQVFVEGTHELNLQTVFATIHVTDDDIPYDWNLAQMQVRIERGGLSDITINKRQVDGDDPPPSGINGVIERLEVPPNTYTFSFAISCVGCKDQVKITAEVTNSWGENAEAQIIIPIQGLATPNRASVLPTSPQEGESFQLSIHQPKDSEEIDEHIYNFYHWIWNENLQEYVKAPISSRQNQHITANADGLSSTYDFQCANKEECSGKLGADIYAKKGAVESAVWIMNPTIDFYVEPPQKPIFESVTPQDKYSSLKNSGTDFIAPDQTVILYISPAPSGPPADKIIFRTTRAGELVEDLSFEQDATLGTTQITIDCSSLKCENREYFSIAAVSTAGGKTSPELRLGLIVYDETLDEPPGVPQICDTGINDSINYMGAGILAMALVIGLVYMGGESLNIPQLIEWSKNEALQLAMIPIMFIIIIWLASTVCTLNMGEFFTWAPTLNGYHIGGDMTIMEAAQAHLQWALGETHLTLAMVRRDLGALNMRATRNNYDNQGLGFGMNGYSHAKFSGDYTSIGTLGMLLNLNTGFMITLLFQYFSLVFFTGANGFFFALIPFGLIMRSIPYLRSFGGGMVALAVGLFIFYPLILAMSGVMLGPLYDGQDASDAYAKYYGGNAQGKLGASVIAVEGNEASITGDGVTSYVNSYPQPKITDGQDPIIDDMDTINFSKLFELTSQNFLRAVFFPTAALLVTVAFIANLAIVFGGEIDASKLVQMV